MTTDSSYEIKDILKELQNGFESFRDKARDRQHQFYRHKEYRETVLANLPPQVTTTIYVPSTLPDHDAFTTEGILRQSFSFHVEPPSGKGERSPDSKSADKQELFYAHLWGVQADKGGRILRPTVRGQCTLPGTFWWADWNEFKLPKSSEDDETYRKDFWRTWPIILNPIPFYTAYCWFDDDGQPTISGREFEIPVVEIANRYGDKTQDENPLRLLNKQFGYLRRDVSRAADSMDDFVAQRIKVCVVDDLNEIKHYIEVPNSKEYYEVGRYPNPWGRPSLYFTYGRFNHDAEKLEDRFVPLMDPELQMQKNIDIMRSYGASFAFTPRKVGIEPMNEAVAAQWQDAFKEGKGPDIIFDQNGLGLLPGKSVELGTPNDPNFRDMLADLIAERDATRPPPYLTNPDQALMRDTTATAQLGARETANRSYDDARRVVLNNVSEFCQAVRNFVTKGYLNKGYYNAETDEARTAAREPIRIYASGNEPTGRRSSAAARREEVHIGPEDFGDDDILEINPVANSESQKSLRKEMVWADVMRGTATHAQYLELDTEDVSGQEEALEEEARFQERAPVIDAAYKYGTAEFLYAATGRNFIPMLTAAGWFLPLGMGGPQQQGNGGSPPAEPNTVSLQSVTPPPTATPDITSQST